MTGERPFDLLVVGELNVDLVLRGDVTPQFGQVEKLVEDMSLCAGGSSSIFAASAAKMGLQVLHGGRVGDDAFGRYMLSAMVQAGIDMGHVHVDPSIKTGATVILSQGDDRAMLTYLGSIAAISLKDVDPAWYGMARHLHVASPFLLSGLRPAMPRMMADAQRAGMTVSLDTNWDPSERWAVDDLFEHLDLFLPNEKELLAIAGREDLDEALDIMLERVPLIVVKRGARGALAATEGRRVVFGGYPARVADATGAGDSFDGGFLAAWLRGQSLERCLRYGSACGGLTIRQIGGFNGQPTWEEATEFIENMSLKEP